MFTGLIQGQGEITAARHAGGQLRLRIACFPLPGLAIGESIAVNGVCLTVEDGQDKGLFSAFVSAETLRCSTLGALRVGARVNLERALALGDRLGGHLVSGHVDAVATVRELTEEGASRRVTLDFPAALAPEVVAKGSVALDGISLTVNTCTETSLAVNIIPETWRVTTAGTWKAGISVNMETDVLGKYVRRNLAYAGSSGATGSSGGVSLELLRDNGFI